MMSIMKAFAVAAMAAPSADDTEMMLTTARSASLAKQIVISCSGRFKVDEEKARKLMQVFVDVGNETFGQKKFSRSLSKEYARRAAEVREQGADSWCTRQRERMIELGEGSVFID